MNKTNSSIALATMLAIILFSCGAFERYASAQSQETSGPVWTDPTTALMWMAADNGADVDLAGANSYCQNLRLMGYSDWRLPAIEEMENIYDRSAHGSFQYGGMSYEYHVKGGLKITGWSWSSTALGDTGFGKANWATGFTPEGRGMGVINKPGGHRALCVRGTGRAPSTAVARKESKPAEPQVRPPAPQKTAQPAIEIVHKPKEYWEGYETDLIRQIFDGSFPSSVGSTVPFALLFNSYLDAFSKDCHAFLPAQHSTLAVTEVNTTRDSYGNVIGQTEGQSVTVEMDSRFAAKYKEYTPAINSGAAGLGAAIDVLSGRRNPFAPGTDAMKFVAREKCQSAATRQLGENLLRAANAADSLQVTILRQSLPPGHFARFVDGCVAYYRAPHPGVQYGSREIEWCQCLSDEYSGVMTPEEEVRYASDFERLFKAGIAQPWGRGNSTADPAAWKRFHPATEKCQR